MTGMKSQIFYLWDIQSISNRGHAYPICLTNVHPLAQIVYVGEKFIDSELGGPTLGNETCVFLVYCFRR